MAKETFKIPNISCGHCVMSIKNELVGQEGVISVEGNPETKTITIEFNEPATIDSLKALLKEINYPAE